METNFVPVKTKYMDKTYVAEGCGDLPATIVKFPEGGQGVASTWKCQNLWERIKFLFRGKVTLLVWGGQPPVCIYEGDLRIEANN